MTPRWRAASFFLPVWLLCLVLLPGPADAKLSVRSAMDGYLTSSTQAHAGAGNTLRASSHEYDANGNRTASSSTESLSADQRSAALSASLLGGANQGSHSRARLERWTYDAQDRLVSHTTPERTITWQLDAGGRRLQQTVVATVGATGPPNALEARAAEPIGTQTYSYNERDQLTHISGARAISYTYDANGNRLTQTETQGANSQTTRYHWNAQDQLVKVEQGAGGNPQLLASYRYNADNLRAEKILGDAGLDNAAQGSGAANTALAYERIQWDGLHARRSYEVTGANNTTQTLRSDTDAAVLAGNTAPILFNRTTYANGVGSASSTMQLHADSQGTVIATVLSEAGAAKADSLLIHSPYGLIDSEASGNAGAGLRSNGNAFGSYYADPETGLLYARARYYDPASGQFVSRDPVEGEANLPITWGAYQYGRYNPYRYTDPNGKCDDLSDCSVKAAGGLVGGIGLTAVKAVEGAISGLGVVADGYLGLLGSKAAQRRNSERLDLISGVIDNADKIPAAVKQAIATIDDKAQAEDAAGNRFTAAMLRGNYAGEIALAVAGLPQAARSAVNLADQGLALAGSNAAKSRVVGRAMEEMVAKADPVLAAKTPTVGPEQVRPALGSTTPDMVVEGPRLAARGETVPQGKTARPTPSESVPEVGSPMGGVANTGMLRQTGGGGSLGAADDLYANIRANTSDVSTIAANTGIKPANIQKVKDHVFYNEHLLDRYVDYGIPSVRARFDSDINQAQAWGRLETGTHTAKDITWLKHETAERWYELRHNSGYTAAHNAAEKKAPGNPWGSN